MSINITASCVRRWQDVALKVWSTSLWVCPAGSKITSTSPNTYHRTNIPMYAMKWFLSFLEHVSNTVNKFLRTLPVQKGLFTTRWTDSTIVLEPVAWVSVILNNRNALNGACISTITKLNDNPCPILYYLEVMKWSEANFDCFAPSTTNDKYPGCHI